MIPARVAAYQGIWSMVPGQLGLPDPYLLAAIGDRESEWGLALTPPGPQGTGDGGHGRGLCQIDDRAFPKWCAQVDDAGDFLWTLPLENVRQACRVARADWLSLLSWPGVVCAYNAGSTIARYVLAQMPPDVPTYELVNALDKHTTGGDYVSDVLSRWCAFKFDRPGGPYAFGLHGMDLVSP